MMRKKGFTLIELLVVISIIALLLSILMPSLTKVKEQARLVVCASNVKQLSVAGLMYATENNDSFHIGHAGFPPAEITIYPNGDPSHMWIEAFRPYYESGSVRLCPSAKQPASESNGSVSASRLAWGIFPSTTGWMNEGDYGSYGFNGWLTNPSRDIVGDVRGYYPQRYYYRKTAGASGSTNNIPVFLDCYYPHAYPHHSSLGLQAHQAPPHGDNEWYGMGRFCSDRHNGKLGAAFLDGSARKIGVKELWKLKWHKGFDTNFNYYPDIEPWPEWMSGY